MSIRITERSLYPIIINVLRDIAGKYGISISGVQEISLPNRSFPDIWLRIDNYKVLIQVKIDTTEKIIDDIAKTYPIARQLGFDLIGILFPKDIRQVRPEELEKVGPNLRVSRGLVLTAWQGIDLEDVTLYGLSKPWLRA